MRMKKSPWIFMTLFAIYMLLILYVLFCFSEDSYRWVSGFAGMPDALIRFVLEAAIVATSGAAFFDTYTKTGEGTKILLGLIIGMVGMASYFSTLPQGSFGSFASSLAVLLTGLITLKRLFAVQDRIALIFAVGLLVNCYFIYLSYMVCLLG